ncbi:MAG TPA: type II toxin-antitoxin system RelE/ParE family toxin [Candidatus Gastranaerophilaceae bacterium]|nr:type II toxin-antitoxin system RelE/ParE family toxin [Candidatus Gastranaerophilaceae bacterium]
MLKKEIEIYTTKTGKKPFLEWFEKLDIKSQAKITARLERIEIGHYGDFKKLKESINELRFFAGSGYRIYFAEETTKIIILLTGGDKSSQEKDIKKATEYYKKYKERKQK